MYQLPGEILPFAEWVAEAVRPVDVLEIGSWKGGSTLLWGRLAQRLVASIDLPNGPFGGAAAGLDAEGCLRRNEELRRRLAPKQFVGLLRDSRDFGTLEQLTALVGQVARFDLLFIDADHSYEGVRNDFERYRHLVRPGRWAAFHDINDTAEHRRVGCEVDRLWAEIKGRPEAETREFNVHGPWGGIGAVRL
jgi:predicted O-methyltransferase YrrM